MVSSHLLSDDDDETAPRGPNLYICDGGNEIVEAPPEFNSDNEFDFDPVITKEDQTFPKEVQAKD